MEENHEITSISLQARIPPFWRENPRLWFAQFESAVAAQKASDQQKFDLVLPVLDRNDIQQISDLVLKPPETGKYEALKTRLIAVYQESESRSLQKLLRGLELGDQRPSQLLRRMKDLGGTMIKDDALKVMWLNQLPASVRAVISVSTTTALEDLGTMADMMMEHLEPQIAAVASSPSSHHDSKLDQLFKQMEKLTVEVAELRGRSRYRSLSRTHTRTRSQSANSKSRQPGDADWVCRYHFRFRHNARRCEEPCNWKKQQTKPPSEN